MDIALSLTIWFLVILNHPSIDESKANAITAHRAPAHALNVNAACICVGKLANGDPIWYPADALEIVPNQPFKGKLTADMTSKMLLFAKKNPDQNRTIILNHALRPLGIVKFGSNPEVKIIYQVRNVCLWVIV